jgi:hypothetical protein
MTVAVTNGVSSRPRVLQFRLGTLLLAMVCIAVVCAALAMPTGAWAGIVLSAALLMLLTAVLLIVYGRAKSRALAVGFVVFAGGYFLFVLVVDHSLSNANIDSTMPTSRLANHLFFAVYARHTQPRAVYPGGPGMPLSGSFGASPPNNIPGNAPLMRTVQVQVYHLQDVGLIMHSLSAIALGIGGAFMAVVLRAAQARDDQR